MACRADRVDRHLRARRLGLADAAWRRRPRVCVRVRDRHLERRLDHFLGPDAVQHARGQRRVREFPALAHLAGHARYPGADDAVRLGVRGAARGPRRLRLSLGGGGADPDLARTDGSRRHPRRGHRQQRAGVVRGARRADHRIGRGDRLSFAGAVRLGRHSGRRPGAAAAMGADLPRGRQARVQGRLAARRRRFAWLCAWPMADRLLLRPVPAGRDRLHRLLLRPAVAAAGLAARPHPRPWRRAGRGIGHRGAGRRNMG